jgi:hypothetical protein
MTALLRVHLQPRARRAGIRGVRTDGTLQVGVTAPPEDGRANRAAESLLAATLGVPASRVAVIRGRTSRTKLVEVEGLSDAELSRRISEALQAGEGGHAD